MFFTVGALLAIFGLLVAMGLLMALGLRLGTRRLARDHQGALGSTVIDTGVFGLLGLMIAFAFYGAANRLDWHRDLNVQEVNAIGTAYMRIELLPKSAQPALRQSFREYTGARVAFYRNITNHAAADRATERTSELQTEIWRQTLAACGAECPPGTMNLVYSSLNAMFDMATTQTMSTSVHPPAVVFAMLFALALVGALIAGYDMASIRPRSWIHLLAFPVVLCVTFYVILDIEFPRRGLIRMEQFDRALSTMQLRM